MSTYSYILCIHTTGIHKYSGFLVVSLLISSVGLTPITVVNRIQCRIQFKAIKLISINFYEFYIILIIIIIISVNTPFKVYKK